MANDVNSAKIETWMNWLSQLPDDVLWTILGFLDLRTLYTARLVCKRLRKTAAEHFKALDCKILEKSPTTDLTQFSGTTYLAVTVSQESHLQSLAHHRIAPVVTHVSLKDFHLRDSHTADEIEAVVMRLPKLRSMSLQPVVGDLHLPLFPPTLEELKITDRHNLCDVRWAGLGDASPLTRYSQLTSLAIDLVVGAGASMESLSSLRNLRSLDLCSCSSALGVLSTLTALTGLTFRAQHSRELGSSLQHITRLTGLSQLALWVSPSLFMVTDVELTWIAQLTNLTSLDITGCLLVNSIAWSTALVPLTRLVSVRSGHPMPRLSRLQLEALHSLTLWNVRDASPLLRATRLTHLELSLSTRRTHPSLPGLCSALTAMSMLRSLEIDFDPLREELHLSDPDDGPGFQLDLVLRACTMLTKLDYGGLDISPKRDLKACAALPGLRSLTFQGIYNAGHRRGITPACLPALQAMSGLTELSLLKTGIRVADMTPAVITAFDAERRKLGWPLLKLRVTNMRDDGCFKRL